LIGRTPILTQVEHSRPRRKVQRLAQSAQFLAGEGVMDAMAALADGKAARKVHVGPLRCSRALDYQDTMRD